MTAPDPEPLFFAGPAELEAWLDAHADQSDGAWVRMARKSSGVTSLDWAGAVDVLLAFGWIDGQVRRLDDRWFVQRITPRRPRSLWSKVNREKAEALIAAGRMRPRGLAEVERARADGRWDAAYAGSASADPPDDLLAAIDAAGLRAAFDAVDRRNRYALIHPVITARRADTRARRIARSVEMLATGALPHPPARGRRPPPGPAAG